MLTGSKAGQYVWAYSIGSLIEEVESIIEEHTSLELEDAAVAA